VSGDLYGDEALFDELLLQAKETQVCQKCGDYIRHPDDEPLRWRNLCSDCRPPRAPAQKKTKPKKLAQKKRAPAQVFEAPLPEPPAPPRRVVIQDERIWDLIIEAVSKKHPSVSLEEIEARVRKAREKHEQKSEVGAKT